MVGRKGDQKKQKKREQKKPSQKAARKKAANKKPSFPSASVPIQPEWPLWYDPLSPLGSAVRYIAGLSGRFRWVGIYLLQGKTLVLGPYLGTSIKKRKIPVSKSRSGETGSELVVLIREPMTGRTLGQIDIDSHTPSALSNREKDQVRAVADQLGELLKA